RRTGRRNLQVRVRRERRSDDRSRSDGADARGDARQHPKLAMNARPQVRQSLPSHPEWPMANVASSAAALGRVIGLLALAACASHSGGSSASPAPASVSGAPPNPDPRVGLRPGLWDAGQAAWNLRLVSNTPSPQGFAGVVNSDLAFLGKY